MIEPEHDLKLTKDTWDVLDIKRLSDAAEPALTADLAVVLITEGLAHVCLVGRSSTILRAKVCSDQINCRHLMFIGAGGSRRCTIAFPRWSEPGR